jgi:hypothetical protein
MPSHDHLKLARDMYGAYESGDRGVVEQVLSDDFSFYSPPDPGIDRATTSSAAGRTTNGPSPSSSSGSWSPAMRSS